MRLQIKFVGSDIIVYREKWGTIAYHALVGLLCLAIAAIFYRIGAGKAPTWFLVLFCGLFALGGSSILFYLPRHAKQIWKNDGAFVIVANANGVTITPDFGSRSLHYPWTDLAEIILTEQLTLVDTDETTSLDRQIIIMPNRDAHRNGHWINEIGTGVAKTAEGRTYLLGTYPKDHCDALAHAFQKLAPSSVQIRVLASVTFSRKSRTDTFNEKT